MKIYVVVEETTDFISSESHMSFESKNEALNHAVSVANGNNGFGDEVKLHSIYQIDLNNKEIIEMEITIVNGRFDLDKK